MGFKNWLCSVFFGESEPPLQRTASGIVLQNDHYEIPLFRIAGMTKRALTPDELKTFDQSDLRSRTIDALFRISSLVHACGVGSELEDCIQFESSARQINIVATGMCDRNDGAIARVSKNALDELIQTLPVIEKAAHHHRTFQLPDKSNVYNFSHVNFETDPDRFFFVFDSHIPGSRDQHAAALEDFNMGMISLANDLLTLKQPELPKKPCAVSRHRPF